MEILQQIKELILIPFSHLYSAGDRLYWPYLLVALAISLIAYLYQLGRYKKSNISDLADPKTLRSIFLHRSAKVDYAFFFVNRILMVTLVVPVIILIGNVSEIVTGFLGRFGESPAILPAHPLLVSLGITILALLVADLSIFIAHYIQHKLPFFWEFHKVHHSAEVLTPITAYRMHPVDDILTIGFGMIMSSALYGVFYYVFDPSIRVITVADLNIFIFLFYLLGFNLRHSPVFVSYGSFWEKIFISPAVHQIHHSSLPEHRDRNFGFIFSFWDRMFRSLVPATPDMHLRYGIGGEEQHMQSVVRLYARPFKRVYQLLRKRS